MLRVTILINYRAVALLISDGAVSSSESYKFVFSTEKDAKSPMYVFSSSLSDDNKESEKSLLGSLLSGSFQNA